MNNLMMITTLFLVGCSATTPCYSDGDCEQNQTCEGEQSLMGGYCKEKINYFFFSENLSVNKPFLADYPDINSSLKGTKVTCEEEMMIMPDSWWGHKVCYRCKNMNESILPNIVEPGDLVC